MTGSHRIEGYAIVSADSMIANADGIMPAELKVDADQQFFARALDGKEVAGSCNRFFAPDAEPLTAEDTFLFGGEDFRRATLRAKSFRISI